MALGFNEAASMKLEGAEQLEQLFHQLPVNLRKKHLRNAIRRGSTVLRDEIKKVAPVGQGSIKTYRKGQKRPKHGRLSRLVRIKPRRQKRTYTKVSLIYPTIGAGNDPKNAYYWRFLEEGTKYIYPREYIIRSVDGKFQAIVRRVLQETKAGIQEDLAKIKTPAPK